jgi:hypothetical protein
MWYFDTGGSGFLRTAECFSAFPVRNILLVGGATLVWGRPFRYRPVDTGWIIDFRQCLLYIDCNLQSLRNLETNVSKVLFDFFDSE